LAISPAEAVFLQNLYYMLSIQLLITKGYTNVDRVIREGQRLWLIFDNIVLHVCNGDSTVYVTLSCR